MKITNRKGLPQPLVNAVTNDPYNPGSANFTVTGLIAPPRIAKLMALHSQDIEEDVSDRIWALLGQAIHTILERAASVDHETEVRAYGKVLDKTVSGQWDFWHDGVLQDYKLTSAWSGINGIKPEWEQQLNCLAWLADENSFHVEQIQIVAIYRDWSRTQALRGGNYPQDQVDIIDIPLWSKAEQLAFLEQRVRAHSAPDLPLCTNEERWYRGEKWAVMKKGRKSAVKLHDDKDAAVQQVDTDSAFYLEHRPGNYVRCESYCAVSAFCDQWKQAE